MKKAIYISVLIIILLFIIVFLSPLKKFDQYSKSLSLQKAKCTTDKAQRDITEFINNYERFIELVEMSDFTYRRHGLKYKAEKENCNLDADLGDTDACNFSYITSIFHGEYYFHPSSGLGYNILIYKSNGIDKIDIAFKGSDSGKDFIDNANQVIGNETDQYEVALKIVKNIQKKNPIHEITLTGHSLGGGVASYVGLITGINTVAFNSARLSGGTINRMIGHNEFLRSAETSNINNVTQIRLYSDIVSSAWGKTSVILGKQYIIPFKTSKVLEGHKIKNVLKALKKINPVNKTNVCNIYYGYSPYN